MSGENGMAGATVGAVSDEVTTRQLLDISCLADKLGTQVFAHYVERFTGVPASGSVLRRMSRREADAFIVLLRVVAAERTRRPPAARTSIG